MCFPLLISRKLTRKRLHIMSTIGLDLQMVYICFKLFNIQLINNALSRNLTEQVVFPNLNLVRYQHNDDNITDTAEILLEEID